MKLKNLISSIAGTNENVADIEVVQIQFKSRNVKKEISLLRSKD